MWDRASRNIRSWHRKDWQYNWLDSSAKDGESLHINSLRVKLACPIQPCTGLNWGTRTSP
jgi:hypothetical protein